MFYLNLFSAKNHELLLMLFNHLICIFNVSFQSLSQLFTQNQFDLFNVWIVVIQNSMREIDRLYTFIYNHFTIEKSLTNRNISMIFYKCSQGFFFIHWIIDAFSSSSSSSNRMNISHWIYTTHNVTIVMRYILFKRFYDFAKCKNHSTFQRNIYDQNRKMIKPPTPHSTEIDWIDNNVA